LALVVVARYRCPVVCLNSLSFDVVRKL